MSACHTSTGYDRHHLCFGWVAFKHTFSYSVKFPVVFLWFLHWLLHKRVKEEWNGHKTPSYVYETTADTAIVGDLHWLLARSLDTSNFHSGKVFIPFQESWVLDTVHLTLLCPLPVNPFPLTSFTLCDCWLFFHRQLVPWLSFIVVPPCKQKCCQLIPDPHSVLSVLIMAQKSGPLQCPIRSTPPDTSLPQANQGS